MTTHKLNKTVKIGNITNPHPASTPGDPSRAGQYYFKASYKGGDTYSGDDVAQFMPETGARRGATPGSTRETGHNKGYCLPATLLTSPPVLSIVPKEKRPAEMDAANKLRLKETATAGMNILATIAPLIAVKVGGSPRQEVVVRLTPAELKEAVKKAGIKPGSDDYFSFVTNPDNMTKTVIQEEIPAGDVPLMDLIKGGGKVEFTGSMRAQAVEAVKSFIGDACREFHVES